MWIIDILLSLVILFSAAVLGRKSIPILIVISGYLVLTYLVYIVGATNVNNYRIWKYSMYATSFMPLLFSYMFSVSTKLQTTGTSISNRLDRFVSQNRRAWEVARKKFLNVLGYVLLFSTALSTFSWVADWESSKTLTVSKAAVLELNSLAPLYDIQVVSSHHLEAVQLAAVSSDLRFGASNRWPLVFRSDPARPFAYLIKITEACDRQCALNEWPSLSNDTGLQEVEGLKFFVVFTVVSSG
jgi:hypothetical protein